jgi:hypothetical protein
MEEKKSQERSHCSVSLPSLRVFVAEGRKVKKERKKEQGKALLSLSHSLLSLHAHLPQTVRFQLHVWVSGAHKHTNTHTNTHTHKHAQLIVLYD